MHMSDHIDDLARELAGNFLRFDSFAMCSDVKPADPERWAVIYTSNRDSGITARSNARIIARALAPYMQDDPALRIIGEDCQAFGASHWAVGHVDGFLMRVRLADGSIAPAFAAYAEIAIGLQDYPIADDGDHSEEEHRDANETWANCYTDAERLDLIRNRLRGVTFADMADLMCCVRGGYAPNGNDGYGYLSLTY